MIAASLTPGHTGHRNNLGLPPPRSTLPSQPRWTNNDSCTSTCHKPYDALPLQISYHSLLRQTKKNICSTIEAAEPVTIPIMHCHCNPKGSPSTSCRLHVWIWPVFRFDACSDSVKTCVLPSVWQLPGRQKTEVIPKWSPSTLCKWHVSPKTICSAMEAALPHAAKKCTADCPRFNLPLRRNVNPPWSALFGSGLEGVARLALVLEEDTSSEREVE